MASHHHPPFPLPHICLHPFSINLSFQSCLSKLVSVRWGDRQGVRRSVAQLNEKGSARCTSSSHCQLQMLWPQPSPSASGAFQALSSLAQVIKANPSPQMRQARLGTEQSHAGCEIALCDALQSIARK